GLLFDGARPSDTSAISNQPYSLISDDASAYGLARLINLAYAGTPAGNNRAASVEALRTLTRDQLLEFYRTHYRPDHLTITVVGDVISFNALVEIQKLYGPFMAGAGGQGPGAGQQTKAAKPISQARNQVPSPNSRPTPQPPAADTLPPTEAEQTKLRYKE